MNEQLDFGGENKKMICGHVMMAPVQPFVILNHKFKQYGVGNRTYFSPIQCMESPGHEGDHAHRFIWSEKAK